MIAKIIGKYRHEGIGKRSGKQYQDRPVYNMTDWDLGWSAVVPLDTDHEKAVNYIKKYIVRSSKVGSLFLREAAL